MFVFIHGGRANSPSVDKSTPQNTWFQIKRLEAKMLHCRYCGEPLRNIGGMGFQPHYICNNPNCRSNKKRRLKCPNEECNSPLTERTIGLGHQMYICDGCGFGFDMLGQIAPLSCKKCQRNARVYPNSEGGFTCECPGCNDILNINP